MNLEGRKSNIYYDQTGRQILVGDLLKVFHYTQGKVNRYMFHVVVMESGLDFPVMAVKGHYANKPHCRLYVVADNEQRIYWGSKIIGTRDWQTKRLKIKPNQNGKTN
jgi:hypothetical protein